MSQFARVLSIFRIKHDYADPFERLRARGLWRITWILILIWLALMVYTQTGSGTAVQNSIYLGIFTVDLIGFAVVLFLINRGVSIVASLLFIIEIFVGTSLAYAFTNSPLLVAVFSIPIIAAGVLLNRRGMLVMIGLTLAALAISAVLNELSVLPAASAAPPTSLGTLIFGVVIVTIDGVFLLVFAGGQRALVAHNSGLAKDLRSSAAISQTIAAIHALGELLDETVTLIRDQLDYYHVHIFLLEEKTNLLVLHAGTALRTDVLSAQQRRIAPDDPGVINRAVQTGTFQMVTASDAAVRRIEMLPGMQSQLVLPLRRGEQVLGVLDLQDINADPFTEDDIEVLQSIAAQLGIAIANAQQFSDLQQASDERKRLAEELKRSAQEIEQLNQEVTERVWTRYLAGRGESVIGYDWKQGTLISNVQGYPGLERTLNSREPELYVENDEHILSVPIISRGQVLGAMEFRAPSNRIWNKRSLELARVISQRLALALDNVRLFEQAQIVATREQLANQIAADLQTKTDMDTLVSVAAETFQQALGATRTNIRLGFPEQQTAQNGRNGSH